MMPGFDALFDLSAKILVLTVCAWLATVRAGLRGARWAHRTWALTFAAVVLLAVWRGSSPAVAIVLHPHRAVAVDLTPGAAAVQWVWAAYGVGVTVLLLRVAAGLAGLRRLRRSGGLIDVEAEAGRVAALHASHGRRVRIVESHAVAAPATAGTWLPSIFLPAHWRELDPAHVDAVMWHELAHVRRRDFLVLLVARVVTALLWFHPAVWFALGRLRWFAELACDGAAERTVGEQQYAEALLALASPSVRVSPLILSAASAVRKRLDLLIDVARPAPPRIRIAAGVVVLIACVAGAPRVRFGLAGRGIALASPAGARHAALHEVRHAAHRH